MPSVGNWISELTNTTGIGPVTLSGVLTAGLVRFGDVFTSEQVWYTIENGNNREAGIGTYNPATDVLTRTTIHATLNAGTYNNSSPVAIDLVGPSVVSCTFNTTAFDEVFAHINDLVNPHGTDFLELLDTPISYVGAGGQFPYVNLAEDGIEFATQFYVDALGIIHVDGQVEFHAFVHFFLSATFDDDHNIHLETFANGFNSIQSMRVDYSTGAHTTGAEEAVFLISIDRSASAGGEIHGIDISATSGAVRSHAMTIHPGLDALEQYVGTFLTPDTVLSNAVDITTQAGDPLNNVPVFVLNADTITIGSANKFSEVEVILDTVASGVGIKPLFEFSTGVGTWTIFSPIDGTDGFKSNGLISWDPLNILTWAPGAGSEYLIRITRTQNSLGTVPIEQTIKSAATSVFRWDSLGDLNINKLYTIGEIGLGEPVPLGTLHVKTGDSGVASVDTLANEIVIECFGDTGMSIITPNIRTGHIHFGDPENSSAGGIHYDHLVDSFSIEVNATIALTIDLNNNIGIGTILPAQDLSGDTADLTGTFIHIKDISGKAGLIIEGTSGGATIDLIDLGGAANDKWMRLTRDSGITKFQALTDLAGFGIDNVLVMDHGVGYVGMGEGAPIGNFHVKSADSGVGSPFGSATQCIVEGASVAGVSVLSTSAGYIVFGDAADNRAGDLKFDHATDTFTLNIGGSDVLTALISGNIGIGTLTPDFKLEVEGTLFGGVSAVSSFQTNNGLAFDYSAGDCRISACAVGANSRSVEIRALSGGVPNTDQLKLYFDGNIGINQNVPTSRLHITEVVAGAVSPLLLHNEVLSATSEVNIRFAPTTAETVRYAEIGAINNGSNLIDLIFKPGAGATIIEQMRLTSSGHLSLGNGAPVDFALNVHGVNASHATGPTTAWTTSLDAHPLLQFLPYTHDNINIAFDAYFNGSWISSDGGSNFNMTKNGDRLKFQYDSGVVAGNTITWNEGLILTTAGHFGIGVVPGNRLSVLSDVSSSAIAIFTHNTSSLPYGIAIDFSVATPNNATQYFQFMQDATAPRCIIYSNGDIYNVLGGYNTISDKRIKHNIIPATSKLGDLGKLKVRNFNLNADIHADMPKLIGFVADEVELIFPGLVTEINIAKNGEEPVMRKTVKTSLLIPMLVKAVQELTERLEKLENP